MKIEKYKPSEETTLTVLMKRTLLIIGNFVKLLNQWVHSNKSITNENIILVENKKIPPNDNKIAEILNNFRSDIVKTFWIPQNVYSDLFNGDLDDTTLNAIVKYSKHPSILISNKRKM